MRGFYNSGMRFSRSFVVLIVALTLLRVAWAHAQLAIATDRTNGVYRVGDTIHWRVEWSGSNTAPPVRYTLKRGGWTDADQGELTFSNSVARLETRCTAPETFLLEAKWRSAEGKESRAVGGVVVEPERIGLSAPRPADFDAFWETKLEELARVPANPRLESADSGKANVAYSKITMDNFRGSRIQGQVARPAQGEKLPALLIVQWAGVYGLQKAWASDRAAEGWLVLNIEPHDLPIDRDEEFYRQQFAGPLKDYWAIGNDDRDTSYFLRMYLSCYRAADYLTQRPDWDGKTLVVMGSSQGGMQSLMTAGLHPRITAALANVPAGCDMLGPNAGRAPGWPQWLTRVEGKDAAKVREASRYYDVANFAPRIKCPVLVSVGLLDETCPPAGILAAMNLISAPKEIVLLPKSNHQGDGNTQAAYNDRCYNVWLPALREGRPAPVRD